MVLSAISDAFKSVLNDVYENGVTAKNGCPEKLFNAYYANLSKSVGKVSADKATLLQNNIARFSAAKTANLMKELDRARVDANGVLLSRKDFETKANTIGKAYNRYQTAEYNTAVHRNRVVKQWEQFQGEKHLYPNIQWIRTRSANPRDLHLQYAGRVWAMDDPFWNENQPGCIWNCKCSWKTTRADVTDNSEVKQVNASPGLEGNPYYTNEIFTANHPYRKRVAKESHIENLGSLRLPNEFAFVVKQTNDGVKYLEHFNCKFENEISGNRQMVEILHNNGFNNIKLLPKIHESEIQLRERYYGKEFQLIEKKKCPDAFGDGKLIEFKKTGYRNKARHIANAALKSDVAVVTITDSMSDWAINNFIEQSFNRHQNLKQIIIVNNDRYIKQTR